MKTEMNRPYVICHIVSSVDGKIDGEYFSMPEIRPALSANRQIQEQYDCKAVPNGTVTCSEIYADGYVTELSKADKSYDRNDHVTDSTAEHYVVCVDTDSTLAWRGNTVERGGQTSHVIEVLTETVSDDYLAYLQKNGISYVFAGDKTLDIPLLLIKLKTLFGIDSLMITGGGV